MQLYSTDGRPLPSVTPVAQPYFEAAKNNRLLMQHCPRDGFFFYPRERCPKCLGNDWEWRQASRTGRIYSYTVERTGQEPGLRSLTPFAIAVVDLDAGPRVIGNIKRDDLDKLHIGAEVSVVFEQVEGAALMYFVFGALVYSAPLSGEC